MCRLQDVQVQITNLMILRRQCNLPTFKTGIYPPRIRHVQQKDNVYTKRNAADSLETRVTVQGRKSDHPRAEMNTGRVHQPRGIRTKMNKHRPKSCRLEQENRKQSLEKYTSPLVGR